MVCKPQFSSQLLQVKISSSICVGPIYRKMKRRNSRSFWYFQYKTKVLHDPEGYVSDLVSTKNLNQGKQKKLLFRKP